MNANFDNDFIDQCIDQILTLATQSLYGENVELALFVVIQQACRYLILHKTGDPELNLLAFKSQLLSLASTATYHSLHHYQKSLIYAASLIAVDPACVPMSPPSRRWLPKHYASINKTRQLRLLKRRMSKVKIF